MPSSFSDNQTRQIITRLLGPTLLAKDDMELEEWLRQLSSELGIDDVDLNDDVIHTVLDLARDAAHQIDRPAAPLTTFLTGVAVGRGASLGSAAAKATSLALGSDNHPAASDASPGTDQA